MKLRERKKAAIAGGKPESSSCFQSRPPSDTFWFRFRTGESLKEPESDSNSFAMLLPVQMEMLPPPVIVKGKKVYKVECFEDSPIFRHQLHYFVQWKGYNKQSWEPAVHMDELQAINIFHMKQPKKCGATAS